MNLSCLETLWYTWGLTWISWDEFITMHAFCARTRNVMEQYKAFGTVWLYHPDEKKKLGMQNLVLRVSLKIEHTHTMASLMQDHWFWGTNPYRHSGQVKTYLFLGCIAHRLTSVNPSNFDVNCIHKPKASDPYQMIIGESGRFVGENYHPAINHGLLENSCHQKLPFRPISFWGFPTMFDNRRMRF